MSASGQAVSGVWAVLCPANIVKANAAEAAAARYRMNLFDRASRAIVMGERRMDFPSGWRLSEEEI
jgi:hypothetical protein